MSTAGTPEVSVVVPVHNAAGLIVQTVRSILAQREVSLEVLVVDDGSRDDSAAACLALGDPRLCALAKPQGGVSSARNVGMRAARGRWMTGAPIWRPGWWRKRGQRHGGRWMCCPAGTARCSASNPPA